MNAGMLANVERVQMQAEGAYLEEERIDESARDANAAVRGERRAQGFEIVNEILDRAVGRQRLG